MKLRTILFVLALLAFLSASSGGYLYYSFLKKSVYQEGKRQTFSRTISAKNRVSSILSENLKSVKALAGLTDLKHLLVDHDKNSLKNAINEILKEPEKIDNPVRRFLYNQEVDKLLKQNVPPQELVKNVFTALSEGGHAKLIAWRAVEGGLGGNPETAALFEDLLSTTHQVLKTETIRAEATEHD